MRKGIHDYIKSHILKLKRYKKTRPMSRYLLLAACSHPRTPSFAAGDRQPRTLQHDINRSAAATLSDVNRYLIENFSSLYSDLNDIDVEDASDTTSNDDEEWWTGSPKYIDDPPTILRPSDRFFTSPGTSSSLIDEARLSRTSSSVTSVTSIGSSEECVAVITHSKDPYEDFRRSMREMLEARISSEKYQPLDWEFMEDLLIYYLELNDEDVHKPILAAFSDLTVSIHRRYIGSRLIMVHHATENKDLNVSPINLNLSVSNFGLMES